MTWAFKHRLVYTGAMALICGGLGLWIGYPYLNKTPTCTDGKQNGDETGVDCGGTCPLACLAETKDLNTLWVRSFEVVPGRYNAVAYVENLNRFAVANSIKYRFRFADANNVYIGQREGKTTIPALGKYAIFEPAVNLGSSVPVYTTFEILEKPIWIQIPEQKLEKMKLAISGIVLENESTTPTLKAKLTNSSFFAYPKVNVVAILYDARGNALSASQTYFEKISPEQSLDAIFTWPKTFGDKVVAKEIIPLWNMLEVK